MNDVVTVIPALNEAENLSIVVDRLRMTGLRKIVVGIDPKTIDGTEKVASKLGVEWVWGEKSGYDGAVHAAVSSIKDFKLKYVLFSDAGGKYGYDKVEEMYKLAKSGHHLVLGIRKDVNNGLYWHQKLGTLMVLGVINLIFATKIKDISPFRLVKIEMLKSINMQPERFQYPSQMLVKLLRHKIKVGQIEIEIVPRMGISKVSGNLRNSIAAGKEMITALKYAWI